MAAWLVAFVIAASPSSAQLAGRALSCDGVNDHADAPSLLSDTVPTVTIEGWVRRNGLGTGNYAVALASIVGIGVHSSAFFTVNTDAGGTNTAFGPNNLTEGVWNHLAGTYDGTTIRIYVNGVEVGSASHFGDVPFVGLRLCRLQVSDDFFNGAVDEVRIWAVTRTAQEIASSYNRKLSGSEDGLIAYYRLDEPSGQTILDVTSNGFDGVLGETDAVGGDDPTRITSGAPLVGSGNCVRGPQTACLLDGRFEVKVNMWNFANPPVLFPGVIQLYGGQSSETDKSASFYSFENGNVEVFVKMVDACTAASHAFWLFAAGATTAETEILVRDTEAEEIYRIFNPRNLLFETVADTQAFLTCEF
jgi:hypothetical protein